MDEIFLEPRKMSTLHAALTRVVGVGLAAPMADDDAQAQLRINLSRPVSPAWTAADPIVLAGAFGEIEFAEGTRFFRAISGIDLGMGGEEQRQWLEAAILGRLGGTPFAQADRLGAGMAEVGDDSVTLRVALRTPFHVIAVDARADAGTWLNFLRSAEWLQEQAPEDRYAELPVALPVKIASHSMRVALLDSIAVGDTILPETAYFDCDGKGSIDVMGLRLRVRYQDFNRVEIVSLEGEMDIESNVDDEKMGATPELAASLVPAPVASTEEPDGSSEEAVSSPEEPAGDGAPPCSAQLAGVERLPVKVDFELGHLQLSLAQLRTIGPGVLLQIEGASPSSVSVLSSGRLLGHGEIVDVNGQLGIRITDWS